MASTREIRRRIKSVKATAQITKALQLVSAAKMRRAQESALGGKKYTQVMTRVLASLATTIDPDVHPLLKENGSDQTAVLFLSSDRGMAGAFTTNLIKEAEKITLKASYVTVGKRGRDYVVKTRKNLTADFEAMEKPDFLKAKQLAKLLVDDFLSGKVGKVLLLYTDFVNTLVQKPKVFELLPIKESSLSQFTTALKDTEKSVPSEAREYIFEPKADLLLDFVLRHFVEMSVYQVMLESLASEHSARMIAMKNATDNALELVDDLTLTYNQARQAGITKELLEITSAAIALE